MGGQGPIRSEEERKKATDGQTESETAGERLCRIKRVRNSSNSTLCRRSVSPSPSVQRRARSPEYARWRQFKVAAASCGGEASREALSKAGSHFHPSNCGWPHRTADGRTTKGASRARGNDILLRARPSVRPSAVRWGHLQLDGWKWESALLNASRLASPPQLSAAALNCHHHTYSLGLSETRLYTLLRGIHRNCH